MELLIYLWGPGFRLMILDEVVERQVFCFFSIRLWYRMHEILISLYRQREGGFRFHIKLPFVTVANDLRLVSVSTGADPAYRVVPALSVKIFGWTYQRKEVSNGTR